MYEEGEDQQKQVYIDKLAELKVNVETSLNCLSFEKSLNYKMFNKSSVIIETRRSDSKQIR